MMKLAMSSVFDRNCDMVALSVKSLERKNLLMFARFCRKSSILRYPNQVSVILKHNDADELPTMPYNDSDQQKLGKGYSRLYADVYNYRI